jgi:transposase
MTEIDGMPYIAFRSTATGRPRGSNHIWRKMYNYFVYNRGEFLQHYHLRSNVESTNNMIKSKTTDMVRSKDKTAQINEVLLKVLCHNICVLISAMFEFGIDTNLVVIKNNIDIPLS